MLEPVKKRIADQLRYLADRLDYANAPRATGMSFTYEGKDGFRLRHDRRGCEIWYLGDAQWERAYAEADAAQPPCGNLLGVVAGPDHRRQVCCTLPNQHPPEQKCTAHTMLRGGEKIFLVRDGSVTFE